MLSIYKTKNAKRVGIIKNSGDSLENCFVYLIEKIRNKISQEDISAVLATYLLFHSTNKQISEEQYRETLEKVTKQKVEYESIKDLKMNYILKSSNASFTLCPYDDEFSDRDSIYISGSAGSGKTWFANMYARFYQHLYPKQEIYYLSVHQAKEDKSITVKGINEIDASKMTRPIKKDEIKKSLLIMDDCDTQIDPDSESDDEDTNKKKSKVKKQRDRKELAMYAKENIITSAKNIVSNSRKYNTSVIFISHKLKQQETHLISTGSEILVCFPYIDYNQIGSFFETRSNISANSVNSLVQSTDRMKFEPLVVFKSSNLYMYQNRIGIF